MALKPLMPPCKVPLGESWSLVAVEAGRTKDGVETTLALFEGEVMRDTDNKKVLASPAERRRLTKRYAPKAGVSAQSLDDALLELSRAVEGLLRQMDAEAKATRAQAKAEKLAAAQDQARHQLQEPPPPDDPAAMLTAVSPCTHVANAQRIAHHFTPTLRYVLGIGWIMWTGTFWRPDPTQDGAIATGFVSGLARIIAEEAAALYSAAAATPTETERKALYAHAEARGRWAVQSENATVIAAGLKLAKHALLLTHDKINPDPWLFNCQNGTVDLRTGTLHAHNPADLITHLAPVQYVADAVCPTWTQFLSEVFDGDLEMVTFIQRALGWCLTGVVEERALFFLYGNQGYNGKSTMVEAMRDLLGTYGEESFGYARKVDVATFMKSKNYEDNLRKSAQLAGARFVYSSETAEGHRLNEELIKDMTGGDTLEARRLYREAFNFKPIFKPWIYGNHKPEIRGTDNALWSRPKLIPFEVSFAHKVNTKLAGTLREELSGILNWAIAGCLAWQTEGLNPPEKVKAATEAYRKEQDVIGEFIRECCVCEPLKQCKASKLYAAYRDWGTATEHVVFSQKRFGAYLTDHGYRSDNNDSGHGALRKGIDLLPAETPPTDPGERNDDDDDPQRWAAPEAPSSASGNATLRQERVASDIASNGAGKPDFTPTHATLATSDSDKSPMECPYGDFPTLKVARVAIQSLKSNNSKENQQDADAILSKSKGSNAGASGLKGSNQGAGGSSYCPGCARASTWILREGMAVCYKCGTQKPQRGDAPL